MSGKLLMGCSLFRIFMVAMPPLGTQPGVVYAISKFWGSSFLFTMNMWDSIGYLQNYFFEGSKSRGLGAHYSNVTVL